MKRRKGEELFREMIKGVKKMKRIIREVEQRRDLSTWRTEQGRERRKQEGKGYTERV